MIVKTDVETDDCTIVLGAREVVELYGAVTAALTAFIASRAIIPKPLLELEKRLTLWLENELVFDNKHNPNRRPAD